MAGTTTVEGTIPEVYVLWHPGCQIGQTLASRVYEWLRPGHGLGPDVYFRCLPCPDPQGGPLPLAIPDDEDGQPSSRRHLATTQVLILLIDCHMVADAAWQYWLEKLAASRKSSRVFLPVALDTTAYNVQSAISRINFLRPSGLPVPVGFTSTDIDKVARRLCKQLTESLCWLFLEGPQGRAPEAADVSASVASERERVAKISIFLSHAKRDGHKPARRIRDYIYSQTQLAAFFDENDIPFGTGFVEQILSGLGAAAIVIVMSAAYSTRPWCRRELSQYRRPIPIKSNSRLTEYWRLNPLVVVDALDTGAATPGIPEIGNSTHIRWSDDQKDLEEHVVTVVLRDALLRSFNTALGRLIPAKRNRIVINWLPDPTTLLWIQSIREAQTNLEVCYPGKGLAALELETLDAYFPRVYFTNFERVLV